MRRGALLLAAGLLAGSVAGPLAAPLAAQEAATATGGELRVLDKLTGVVIDVAVQTRQTRQVGNLSITLQECRYPVGNPASDAWVLLEISLVDRQTAPLFQGWMVASAPALNAMDHPRYDVWALRCMPG
ncbi:MAG: DUF2155 domain-containing protein [Rubellimicrobium sp.]|nr:DUF2155 domain-containing protein [Rubellimicrobium sp.]